MHGLPNVGATCYLNAAVQLLRAAQLRKSEYCNTTPLDSVLTADQPTASMMIDLVHYIRMPHGQQDSQEALQNIIEKSDILNKQTQFKLRSQIYCRFCQAVTSTQSTMENMFICTPTPDLSLHKIITAQSTLHQQANVRLPLDQYIRRARTNLSGWRCSQCNRQCEAIKEDSFSTISNIILVVFPRYNSPKEPLAYTCPDTLQYYCRIDGRVVENNYRFIGSIDHSGSLSGGHYTARVVKNEQAWFCNDSIVQITNTAKPGKNTVIVAYSLV